ncbi:branched-chain amino acid ABC transporter permease [Desulfotignum balticum]|jgi:branched-chain amino acid transport system permease protein|uniref:branched-chain amino acid ABC transporter permease n=1 Tax=Desulfotignum balticum TaxID=115781 RepID=UPI00040D04E0|nr:branched-chain amino acid ABC transporter permease [Desulfotignum balticum]
MEPTTNDLNMNLFDRALDRLCLTPIGLAGLILLLVLPFIPPFNQEYMLRWLIYCGFVAAMSVGFDFTAGYINIVNFGYMAVAGTGGYTSALLVINAGLSPWIAMLAGGVSSAVLGLIIGMISLRLRGIFAACLSWFFGLAVMGLAIKMVWLTRGPLGLRTPRLFETESNVPFYFLIIILVYLTYLICKWVVRSKMGLAFQAIAQNMDAARTSGINPIFYRVFNFTMSCAIAGVLGGFYAHFYGILTPDMMHTSKTVEILAVAYIGGRGSLWGGAVVAFPFIFLMEIVRSTLSHLPGLNLVIYALVLILVMIYYPGGFSYFYDTHIRQPKNRALRYFLNGREAKI